LSLQTDDPAFSGISSNLILRLPGGDVSCTVAPSQIDSEIYTAAVSTAVLSTGSFYPLEGQYITLVVNSQNKDALIQTGIVVPSLGARIGEPSGTAEVI